jgi:hypothetical protein
MKKRYVYTWNGIEEAGGDTSYFYVFSSRKKVARFALKRCESYGFVEPQIRKQSKELKETYFVVDYQGLLLGSIKRLEIS